MGVATRVSKRHALQAITQDHNDFNLSTGFDSPGPIDTLNDTNDSNKNKSERFNDLSIFLSFFLLQFTIR